MIFRKGELYFRKEDGSFEPIDILMGGAEIADSETSSDKTWSSNKIDDEIDDVKADLTQLTTTVNGKQNTLTSQDKQDIVKTGITTATLTDAEKASACGTIGAAFAVNQWVKIADVTLESDGTNIDFNADYSGNDFSLSEVLIFLNATSMSGAICCTMCDTKVYAAHNYVTGMILTSSATNVWTEFHAKVDNGFVFSEHYRPQTAYAGMDIGTKGENGAKLSDIKSFRLRGTYGSGTTIKIYGKRYNA